MAPLTLALKSTLALLMIDSIVELSLISSMVSWLHRRAGRDFIIDYNNTTFPLHGKPLNLLVDQGHTSNGAAGTAFVLIGLGGILALWLRNYKLGRPIYYFWLVMAQLSMLLTLAALIYTFVLTREHEGHAIDIALAASLDNKPYPNMVPYPMDKWTPELWFSAVLELSLRERSDRSDIRGHLRVMKGWRWNLIPMFILGLAVAVLAVMEAFVRRRQVSGRDEMAREAEKKISDSTDTARN
ncbi:hypothetical protein MYCFIDRAFT_210690 [Lecanosticta acicola]|uniref:Uncharacterized protein n=1 Tax=Lecanosticta acicola TaxID=111012 RepID=A0AAI8YS86_9PEZI|nr:hypothetical protein MYCFIDRAFT_210690 [Lecanosticta acicola]